MKQLHLFDFGEGPGPQLARSTAGSAGSVRATRPRQPRVIARVRGGWEPPEHIRVPGVRFAPEVPRSDCYDCSFAPTAHPCVENPLDGSLCLVN
ncbi:MAG: hypothetical protein PHZ19_09940 [Candidatus Thermoplasmatota archaeon]|nr:hypothetical protein [Candidatus Thermoplasmatota archaeon]